MLLILMDDVAVVILERPIRIPRSLSVKAGSVLKGFLNKVSSQLCHFWTFFCTVSSHKFYVLAWHSGNFN